MSFLRTVISSFHSLCAIWYKEIRYMLMDEGMLLFVTLLPLVYPVIYSWIYNNEVVREVPVVVVDKCRTVSSRNFLRQYDASPNVRVAFHATDLDEARRLVGRQEAYGVVYIPSDFDRRLHRMEQATVSVYCDMSLMLVYKNVYQTAVAVCSEFGTEIQKSVLALPTARDEEIATAPVVCDEVALYNTTGGYGNFILPGVLVLILQQTILLGMGITSGTLREKYGRIVMRDKLYTNVASVVGGKFMAYILLYAVMSAYVLLVIPRMFGFVSIIHAKEFLFFLVPYLMSCIFFSMSVMSIVRQREDVLMLVVFTSVVLLFLSGVSWPASNIPVVWEWLSWFFPSTWGIKAYIAMNSMGARLPDVMPCLNALWLQTVVYALLAVFIYRRELSK
ncbi:MAG: ABC transporter permease [Bacteroidales bacterium]|nr:ABC transporter permease [Bacteroidales bacterium]